MTLRDEDCALPRRFSARTAVCLGLLLAPACLAQAPTRAPIDEGRVESAELGSMRTVSFADGLWFGSEPAPEDLDLARRRGVQRIIALQCRAGSSEWDVREACSRLGFEFLEVELPAPGKEAEPMADGAVDRIVGLLAGDGPRTLMFCEDGQRCAMLFAIHLVVNEGLGLDAALNEAGRAGMDPALGEPFVRAQVSRLMGGRMARRDVEGRTGA